MKTSTLSLKGNTGTVARNRDNTHEDAVINLTGEGGITGQLSIRQPVVRKDGEVVDDDTGLDAGEYSVSLSLTRKADEVKAAANEPATTTRAARTTRAEG